MAKDDIDAIRKATEKLGEVIQKIGGQRLPGAAGRSRQPVRSRRGPQAGPGEQSGPQQGGPQGGPGPSGEDVVDGEFKQV